MSGETAVDSLVQVDEAALDREEDQRWLRGVVRDDQRVGLAGGLVDERAGLRHPVMFQVPPLTTYRKTPNGPDVVVSAQRGAWETFQDNAESAGRDIEVAEWIQTPSA